MSIFPHVLNVRLSLFPYAKCQVLLNTMVKISLRTNHINKPICVYWRILGILSILPNQCMGNEPFRRKYNAVWINDRSVIWYQLWSNDWFDIQISQVIQQPVSVVHKSPLDCKHCILWTHIYQMDLGILCMLFTAATAGYKPQ